MTSDSGNILYRNRSADIASGGTAPDSFQDSPPDDFALCRDEYNEPTALYGGDVWNFNPYRLSEKRVTKIHFYDNV